VPFWVLDGFAENQRKFFGENGGDDETRTRDLSVTVSGLQVLSTTWKSTDGTASHWKYVVDKVIVYRELSSTQGWRVISASPVSVQDRCQRGDHFPQAGFRVLIRTFPGRMLAQVCEGVVQLASSPACQVGGPK